MAINATSNHNVPDRRIPNQESSKKSYFRDLNRNLGNPDFFQKVCQVAFSAIQAYSLYVGRAVLGKLDMALVNVSSMHNFLGFFKLPYNWVYPISTKVVDEYQVLNSLRPILQQQLNLNENEATEKATAVIKKQLEYMVEGDVAYRNIGEMKKDLGKLLPNVNLNKLEIKLQSPTLLARISKISFNFVDIGCFPLYLDIWNISVMNGVRKLADVAGLGAQAQALGQTKAFQWLGKQDLGDWLWSLCCVGYAADLITALQKLIGKKALTDADQRERAFETAVTTFAELVWCSANLARLNETILVFLTIVTKSIGIVSIIYKKEDEFFARESA